MQETRRGNSRENRVNLDTIGFGSGSYTEKGLLSIEVTVTLCYVMFLCCFNGRGRVAMLCNVILRDVM